MRGISVIVLAFKNQKYELKSTLKSILNQCFMPKDIIIVDTALSNENIDFIKDDISGTIKYIQVKDCDLKDYSEQNLFEIGAKQASGDYLAFIQVGDTWEKEKLSIIANFIKENNKIEFLVHSYKQRVALADIIVDVNKTIKNNYSALFQLLIAKSSVVMRKQLFYGFDSIKKEEIESLNVKIINDILSAHVSEAKKDLIHMEKAFWEKNYKYIKEKELIQEAAVFCIEFFQKDIRSKNSFMEFAKNVELSSEDSISVLFGNEVFSREVIPASNQIDTSIIARKQQNYILMRNWLELKLNGNSIAEKLSEREVAKIAIYGAGKHGSLLYKELQKTDIKILFWLDTLPKSDKLFGIPVISLEDKKAIRKKSKQVDAIVVTPFMEFNSIVSNIMDLGFKNIISLDELVK